ncbi:MAG: LysM peptidoglycan-binding domain-containing protein [Proteobacteria bacterium]|nr:LysM peptidoglycan-binding domain-containing protein [Pseudomonadota bacterium]
MKMHLRATVALIALLFTSIYAMAADIGSLLREDHPDQYMVKEGDTLWGIAGMFLTVPWYWPEIWHVNPEIKNPHLIYPGDEIVLKYVGGDPMLTLKRGPGERTYKLKPQQSVRQGDRFEKLEPKVRMSPLSSAIPAIPLDAVASLMSTGRIVEEDTLSKAPYILAGRSERLIFGPGDQFYARGDWDEETSVYGIFRSGNTYKDPDTGDVLGYEAIEVGLAKAVDREGDIVTFDLVSVKEDVRIGDRLMPTEERRVESTFYPTPPEQRVEGVIMTVLGGVTQVGRNDVVVVNRGLTNGVGVGTVLAIAKQGPMIRDRFARDRKEKQVQLPSERAGILMIFRAFDRMAYGLVLETTEPLRVGDVVRNP